METPFQWIKLNLKTIPQLEREVDQVSVLYAEAQDQGDGDLVERFYQEICRRIDELEDFYLEQGADSRSMLIEKQRIRLKKCLQYQKATSYVSNAQHLDEIQQQRDDGLMEDTNNTPNSFPGQPLTSNQATHTPVEPPTQSRPSVKHTRRPTNVSIQSSLTSVTSTPSRRTRKPSVSRKGVKPIYSWEKTPDDVTSEKDVEEKETTVLDDRDQPQTTTRANSMFIPTDAAQQAETYARLASDAARSGSMAILSPRSRPVSTFLPAEDGDGSSTNSINDGSTLCSEDQQVTIANVKIRVSEKDYHLIMARQRVISSAKKHQQLQELAFARTTNVRNAKCDSDRFLFSKVPYEDYEHRLREEDPDQWIDVGGFQRSAKEDFPTGKE